jgi:cytochrome c556
MKRKGILAAMLMIAAVSTALASASDIVESRQSDMKAMASAAKTLNEYFVGKRRYDLAKFRTAADSIRRNAGRITGHFARIVEAPTSAASPFIKVDHVKFDMLAHQLEQYAGQVSAAAMVGDRLPEGMRMKPAEVVEGGPFANKKLRLNVSSYTSEHAFHMMLQTCTSCHASFRLKR